MSGPLEKTGVANRDKQIFTVNLKAAFHWGINKVSIFKHVRTPEHKHNDTQLYARAE